MHSLDRFCSKGALVCAAGIALCALASYDPRPRPIAPPRPPRPVQLVRRPAAACVPGDWLCEADEADRRHLARTGKHIAWR